MFTLVFNSSISALDESGEVLWGESASAICCEIDREGTIEEEGGETSEEPERRKDSSDSKIAVITQYSIFSLRKEHLISL